MDVRLVVLLTCACTGLFVMFGWIFVLHRSPVALVFLFLRQYMSRDTSNADKPIVVPSTTQHFRDTVLTHQSYSFDEALRQQGVPPVVPAVSSQSVPTATDPGVPAPYPRPLTSEEEDSVHPFRTMSADFNQSED